MCKGIFIAMCYSHAYARTHARHRPKGNATEFLLRPECVREASPVCPLLDSRTRANSERVYLTWIATDPSPLPAPLRPVHPWLAPLAALPASPAVAELARVVLRRIAVPDPAAPVSEQTLVFLLYMFAAAVREDQACVAAGAAPHFLAQVSCSFLFVLVSYFLLF